jgi:hypothetical protein
MTIAGAVACGLMTGAVALTSSQPAPMPPRESAFQPGAVIQTARDVVRAGQSAGIVVKLSRPGRRDGGGPVFDLAEAAPADAPSPPIRGTPAQILGRHVDGSRRFVVQGSLLVDSTATGCRAFVSRRVAVTVSGHVFGAAVAIFNAGSRQNIPKGIVGTCAIGVAKGTRETVSASMRGSVRQALEMAVSQAAGVVWLAVEDVDGRCALGMYARDELRRAAQPAGADEGPFCAVQIGRVPR